MAPAYPGKNQGLLREFGRLAVAVVTLSGHNAVPARAEASPDPGPRLQWQREGWVVVDWPNTGALDRGTLLVVRGTDSPKTIGVVATGEVGESHAWVKPVCLARAPSGAYYRLQAGQQVHRLSRKIDQDAGHCIARVTAHDQDYVRLDRDAGDGLKTNDEYVLLMAGTPLNAPGQAILARCAIPADDNLWESTGTRCTIIGQAKGLPAANMYSTVFALWTGNPNAPLPMQHLPRSVQMVTPAEGPPPAQRWQETTSPPSLCSSGLRLAGCVSALGSVVSLATWAVMAARIRALEGDVEKGDTFPGSDYDSGARLEQLQLIPLGIGLLGAATTAFLWLASGDAASPQSTAAVAVTPGTAGMTAKVRF